MPAGPAMAGPRDRLLAVKGTSTRARLRVHDHRGSRRDVLATAAGVAMAARMALVAEVQATAFRVACDGQWEPVAAYRWWRYAGVSGEEGGRGGDMRG
eukprot:363616-Chlamydomonas_euryale.AAC.6